MIFCKIPRTLTDIYIKAGDHRSWDSWDISEESSRVGRRSANSGILQSKKRNGKLCRQQSGI